MLHSLITEVIYIETNVVISFFVEYKLHNKIEKVFSKYGIDIVTPEKPKRVTDIYYEVPFILDSKNRLDTISTICNELKTKFNIDCGEMISYKFNDDDFNYAPLFELKSTGNSAKAFLSHKKDSVKLVSLCSNCGIQAKIQQSPLVMDTSKIGDRYMVNVGTDYWIISEKMASLMNEWEITGYTLKEVLHNGKNPAKSVFQLIPTNILPPWSAEMKHYSFVTEPEKKCSACSIRGRIDYPYHYNKSDLEEHLITDVNLMREWKPNGNIAYQPIFFSKKFRDLLNELNITRGVRDKFAKNYKSKDWLFEPVIIVQ